MIDFDQIDFGEPPPQLVIGWNEERCERECPRCNKQKTFLVGATFWNDDDAHEFVCPGCAKASAPGLHALWEFASTAMEKPLPPAVILDVIRKCLMTYRHAIGLPG